MTDDSQRTDRQVKRKTRQGPIIVGGSRIPRTPPCKVTGGLNLIEVQNSLHETLDNIIAKTDTQTKDLEDESDRESQKSINNLINFINIVQSPQ